MKKTCLALLVLALAAPSFARADGRDHHRKDPLTVPLAGVGTLSGECITSGTLKIVGFAVDRSGSVPVLNAIGILNAQSATHSLVNQPVQIPVLPSADGTSGGLTSLAAPIAAAPLLSCSILNLVLGSLHLDLLGLVVDLNQVVLDITAQPGPSNLLGNLLCGVLGLLDLPGAIGAVVALVGNLNTIVAGLGL
jgi:hypothetical protein